MPGAPERRQARRRGPAETVLVLHYLGSGELATAPATTRADLIRLLHAARKLDIPLLNGTAGSAGAAPHLEKTRAMVRDIARADRRRFRLASMPADMPRQFVREAVRSGHVTPIDSMAPLGEADIDEAWSPRSMRRPLSLARGPRVRIPLPPPFIAGFDRKINAIVGYSERQPINPPSTVS